MRLLTINVGSSSLKAVLYRVGQSETVEIRAAAERIGIAHSCLRISDAHGTVLLDRSGALPDHATALVALSSWLRARRPGASRSFRGEPKPDRTLVLCSEPGSKSAPPHSE
jgi:acetate kinase